MQADLLINRNLMAENSIQNSGLSDRNILEGSYFFFNNKNFEYEKIISNNFSNRFNDNGSPGARAV